MQQYVEAIYQLRPWYHDFSGLGIQTKFDSDAGGGPQNREHMKQQARKEATIGPFIRRALADMPSKGPISILDLFCADGYYGLLTQKLCPESVLIGVDRNPADVQRCWCMASQLRSGPVNFISSDVYEYVENRTQPFDLVLCFGGLYHISDPLLLIKGLRRLAGKRLVLQSAIPVNKEDPDYYETPNPWFKTWGSLFSFDRLIRWVEEAGFDIIDKSRDSRDGPNPQGIGGAYVLAQ